MRKITTWVEEILPLDRPEYAKQPEALLTDLFWRSHGSSLSQSDIKLTREHPLSRLVPRYVHGNPPKDVVETYPLAKEADIGSVVQGENSKLVNSFLLSIEAPKARGVKSVAYVPVHQDLVSLQTLRGILNKPQPANVANIIETMGLLGGSKGKGEVARFLLQTMKQDLLAHEGFPGIIDGIMPLIAKEMWGNLFASHLRVGSDMDDWPGIGPIEDVDIIPSKAILSGYPYTPFQWFWTKWEALCSSSWYSVLPTRRFVDWATCLLRTGLAFSYLWEATFFVKLHSCIDEELLIRGSSNGEGLVVRNSLYSMLKEGVILATIEEPTVPATQKQSGKALNMLLARGYESRKRLIDFIGSSGFYGFEESESIEQCIDKWIESMDLEYLRDLSRPLDIDNRAAQNTREFVRYLLLPRSSDDDSRDQADFYYLARTNSQRLFWFQPGPEWLVVVASLLGVQPGGKCTLGMLLNDFRKLGIRIDRHILVKMLEEAGLSSDSPDADNALVIQTGFGSWEG